MSGSSAMASEAGPLAAAADPAALTSATGEALQPQPRTVEVTATPSTSARSTRRRTACCA